jgi:hypothetical protein
MVVIEDDGMIQTLSTNASDHSLLASARHLSEQGEVPVLILSCVALDTGGKTTITTGASIYPAVQNILLAARALLSTV